MQCSKDETTSVIVESYGGVGLRHMRPVNQKKAYAVKASATGEVNVVWAGEALQELTKFPAFRAKYVVYVQ